MFFNFLKELDGYTDAMTARLATRHRFLVEPFAEEINGARVLDLAAHDGRWSYALAAAGAREVIGVEARRDVLQQFGAFPPKRFKARVKMNHNDIFRALATLNAGKQSFDVVAMYGIFYHITNHYELLARSVMLRPKIIIVDSEFITDNSARIHFVKERTQGELNATRHVPGQEMTLVGVPTMGAIERMAEVLGYRCDWLNWNHLPEAERIGVADYYRDAKKRRRTCVLRPMEDVT